MYIHNLHTSLTLIKQKCLCPFLVAQAWCNSNTIRLSFFYCNRLCIVIVLLSIIIGVCSLVSLLSFTLETSNFLPSYVLLPLYTVTPLTVLQVLMPLALLPSPRLPAANISEHFNCWMRDRPPHRELCPLLFPTSAWVL